MSPALKHLSRLRRSYRGQSRCTGQYWCFAWGICACDLRQAAQSHFLNLVLPEQCEDEESADVPVSLYASQQLRQP